MRHGAFFSLAAAAVLAGYSVTAQAEEVVYLDQSISFETVEPASDIVYTDVSGLEGIIFQDEVASEPLPMTELAADEVLTVYENAIVEQAVIDGAYESAAVDGIVYIDDTAQGVPVYEEVTFNLDTGEMQTIVPATY